MGNGTKFKLSSMFPSVLSKIKGMTGKKPKGKGTTTNSSDWSEDLQDISTVSKDSAGGPPSPVRTFPQNRDMDMRCCSSPRYSSPVNHKSYDIHFPIESPVRKGGNGMKSRPVSPPRRSANSTDSGCGSFDSTPALLRSDRALQKPVPPSFGRCLQRSKCNSLNSDTHSDSELDITESQPLSARAHLRARTMSLQLDGTTEWEREREREREWSEPERSGRRRTREAMSKMSSTGGEPSPIHTVRCMPPNTPSDTGHYSDPRDMECHRSACPDVSRDMSGTDLRNSTALHLERTLDRKLSFTTDDNRLFDDTCTSFSSDEDFFKVCTQQRHSSSSNAAIDQYRLKKLNYQFGNGDTTDAGFSSSTDVVLTEDDERSLRREAVLAKAVRNAATMSDGWARVQSRFAEEEKHAQQLLQTTMGRRGRVNFDHKAAQESDVLLTEDDERQHASMCRREASLVKTVLSAKDWARENLRALSKANELQKQAKLLRAEDFEVEYESFGLPVIHKEHLHSRGSSRTHSPVGEVEKHTKGRIDYKSSLNDSNNHDNLQEYASDNLVYEHFSQPLAEHAIDFYRNALTEESDFESSITVRPWEVEFPSFRSDRGSRRSGPVGLSESEASTPRSQRSSVQERSSRTPKKQISPTSATNREALGKKASRSASSKVHEAPLSSVKPSSRSGSPRRQDPHYGRRATSPRTPSSRQEAVSKKVSRTQSPRQQEVYGKKPSSNSPSPRQHRQQKQDASNNNSKVNNARNVSPAHLPAESQKTNGGNARSTSQARSQEERASEMGSDSVAVVKASYDPYQDFRDSMVEMILENDIQTAEDLEELLQCYLSLNSAGYHSIIVQVFSDIWRDIFDQ